jgi:hypothetical protein
VEKVGGGDSLTLVKLRALIAGPSAWARVLLLSAFAGALIVGLLAMHTIASTGTHAEPLAHTAMVLETGDSGMGASPAADDCAGTCAPAHDTSAMACILALLVGILVIGASRRVWAGPFSMPSRIRDAASGTRPTTRSLPPPDLDILSISRT